MCESGDFCQVCHSPADMEVHWACWVGKFCTSHGRLAIWESELYENPPTLTYCLTSATF